MNRLLTFSVLALLANPALGQASFPPCNTFDAAGSPAILVNGVTSNACTDYFGVANWANSPLPIGPVSATFTIMSGGIGYSAPVVTITDFYGASGATGATATATLDVNGSITAVTLTAAGSGYIAPVVTVTDATGSGAMILASIDPLLATGGIHKFVDTLPDLKGAIAVPDTTTFANSDYYVIELWQYTTQLHANLPPTTLRGYCQRTAAGCTPSYLGPVILAQKDRPVRVVFKNMLPAGAGGNLFLPVDPTFMGAGMGPDGQPYSENRATLHLHGGASPWISDGTPHQWTTPAAEVTSHARGVSTQMVPDMWFDASGNLIPGCAGQTACNATGATTDPGPGAMTFYWTNQQGGRLMFYHDHAYGLTRLNVYAGEAAGYLLYDPIEEAMLLAAGVPGTIASNATQLAPDLAHLIPLVIQDKTFVPSPGQLAGSDPTWAWGTTSPQSAVNGNGDLWFPHVYMPNQDPNDPLGGASAVGRWDYGPWFFPPQNQLSAANPPTAVTVPCTSAAFPGQVLAPTTANPVGGCPIIPNPSGTPEAFMDTPVVNGKAYPVLHVAPEAYRFKILSAGNDRSWNLQLYVADATGKDVTMLPAVPPSTGSVLPLCPLVTPVTQPGMGLGLATALLDATGKPINGTGLPANCWPNYGAPMPGIPSKQFMWPADGRDGGVPDPRLAGPPFVQIGSEGGLLPAPVVIPSTPAGYEYNTRSITVTNVSTHGLWLGPAERADVVVDFTAFAGKTLILYNDAPTPAPAFDSRADYYTGDLDQVSIGGAPSTLPGYGPNTRTLMQIVVDGTPSATTAFNIPALKAALPGTFASTQPTTIVPEPTYPANSGGNAPTATYGRIQDNSITFTPCQSAAPGGCSTGTLPQITVTYDQKAIQELFTLDYGRMNATLGVELPFTNFLTQTTIPYGYVDWPTEILQDGQYQIWKLTHNGVDTHFIHFHLFNVQVVNRIGWDGSVRPPDQNELGWKDTVRMNPLEDIVVALQPVKQTLPWPLPDSIRPNDVTMPTGMPDPMISGIDPVTGNATVSTTNNLLNFGWEYVWHCHILGHEENDMMRPVIFQVAPPAPSSLVAAANASGGATLMWTDNSASESGFTLQRDTVPTFDSANLAILFTNANPSVPSSAFGGTQTFVDLTAPAGQVYYRVQAVDDFTPRSPQPAQFQPATLVSAWSNIAPLVTSPILAVTPASLSFGNQLVGTTGGPLTLTVSNLGTAPLTFTGTPTLGGSNPTEFATPTSTNPCGASLAPATSCLIAATFTPTAVGARSAVLTIASNDPISPAWNVPLSGSGFASTAASISAPTIIYGQDGVVTVSVASPQVTPVPGTVTLSVDGGAPLSAALASGSATFTLTAPSAGSHTLSAAFAAQGGFTASSATGTLTVTPAALTITASSAAMTYGGAVPAITPSYASFVLGQTPANLTGAVTCSTTATPTSPVGTYPSTCSGATSTNYAITYVPGTVTVGPATTTTTITSNLPSPSIVGQIVTISVSVAPQFTGTPTGSVSVAASTGESCAVTLAAGKGSCQIIFGTGGSRTLTATYAGDPNFLGSASAPATQVVSSVTLSTTSLLFGNQRIGTTSASQAVTLANVGLTPLAITSVAVTGDFLYTTNCPVGGNLLAGRTCRINVSFRPTAAGVRTGTLSITDSDPTSPQKVSLTGTGVTAPFGTLSATSINFGSLARGSISAPRTVTLTNTGGSPLVLSNVRTFGNTADFPFTTTCTIGGTGMLPGASCSVTVRFAPQRRFARTATLTFTDNASNSPQNVALSGTGL
jgi:FtsP/CotA-like multicopper oxidase with cupredoxin domain